MTMIRRPTPFAELASLRDSMERLFDDRLFRPLWIGGVARAVVPALDLYVAPDAVIARIALAGVKPDDVDIAIAEDLVTISGTLEAEEETTEWGYVHRELSHGSFCRTFSVPTAVRADAATASFRDGLLTLTLPKSDERKPTHVKVDVA